MMESPGKSLKKIRESKNISAEEASEKSRIPKKIIAAIEEDRLQDISSVFYARGFVKTYASFLGALEETKVKEFLSTGRKKDDPRLILKDEKARGDWFIKHRRKIGSGIAIIFSAYLLLFGFIHVGRFMKNTSAKYKARAAEKRDSKEKAVAAKAVTLKPAPVSAAVPVSVEKEKKDDVIEIHLKARYNTWIQVVSDGSLVFRGALNKGTSDVWKAKKTIEIELGNAGGVTLMLNGKDLGFPGKKGEKKTLVITRDGVISK
ncbi:MAG: DUF4115 domain-containing protein [Candidatus Omnitrophica bacterium]|nr:DUF4115 domain-containing protein [Candidatus Omnitrophota bacterium]